MEWVWVVDLIELRRSFASERHAYGLKKKHELKYSILDCLESDFAYPHHAGL